jgi:tetratricopeptide (TPR) repeat protein
VTARTTAARLFAVCLALVSPLVLESRVVKAQGVEEAPKHAAVAHNQLGLRYAADGKLELAEKEFKAAVAIDSRFAEAQNNLGVLYGHQGKKDLAEAMFQQAIESDPQYSQAYVNLVMGFIGQNRLADAKETVQKLLQVAPDLAAAHSSLGMVEAKLGLGREAVNSFRRVVALEPGSAEAHLNLGIALAEQLDLNGGLLEFSEAVRLSPTSVAAHYHKGRALFNLARFEETKGEIEAALRIKGDFSPALYILALTEKQMDHVGKSIELFQQVIDLEPRNANAHYLLGQNLLRVGKTEAAVFHWRRCIEINPEYAEALYNLYRIVKKTDPATANLYQERFLALQQREQITTDAENLRRFALARMEAGDWPQAIEQLHEALSRCGDCRSRSKLHKDLGLIYSRLGRLPEGERELQLALKQNPNDGEVLRTLEAIETLQENRPAAAKAP